MTEQLATLDELPGECRNAMEAERITPLWPMMRDVLFSHYWFFCDEVASWRRCAPARALVERGISRHRRCAKIHHQWRDFPFEAERYFFSSGLRKN